ncbi:MAG: hypothetical protein A2Y43_00525 [Tenericutes bacterium GWA2_38_26]|nr:MAG: hypothetical protein A2Y43_00525 [Tenericutes bacterium GWA2_38_26]
MKTVKRLIILILITIFVSFLDFSPRINAETGDTIYLSAAEYGYPPFSLEVNGQADGFSVQLLKAVAVEMGIQLEFKLDYWSIIKQELIDGELDVLPLVGYTEDRDLVLDFTVPYIVMRGNIFVRDNDDSIQSTEDLFGKEILVLSGDNSEEYARSIGLDTELTATATYSEAFNLLSDGSYDAVLAQGLVGEKIIFDEAIKNVSPVYILDNNGISRIKLNLEGYEQKFCFAVTDGNAELLSILNEGLSIVSANGTYDTLYTEWFPFLINDTPSMEKMFGIIITIIVPLIILVLLTAIYTVRREVKNQTEHIIKSSTSNQIILAAFEKKFNSEEEQYAYFLEETIRISESHDAIMFSMDQNHQIKVHVVHFELIEMDCEKVKLGEFIASSSFFAKMEMKNAQWVFNDFGNDLNHGENQPECLKSIKNSAILTYINQNQEMLVTLVANKEKAYTKDDMTQLSILIAGFVGMIERANYVKQIEHLSYHDSLTGLHNRRYLEEQMILLNKPENHPISIIVADVNGLKKINDSFGHSKGDILLKKTSELIKKHSKGDDIIARWGGDEYVVILPNSTEKQVTQFIKDITTQMKKESIENTPISIAFGYHSKVDTNHSLADSFKIAEKRMYEVKGRMNRSKLLN